MLSDKSTVARHKLIFLQNNSLDFLFMLVSHKSGNNVYVLPISHSNMLTPNTEVQLTLPSVGLDGDIFTGVACLLMSWTKVNLMTQYKASQSEMQAFLTKIQAPK